MSSTATLAAERDAALVASGWGAEVKLFQPRNLAFWVYLAIVGGGIYTWVPAQERIAGAYGQALLVATVLFALYGALFWWFTQRIDRYARQSLTMIALAFGWGAFAATWAMAAQANTPIISLWAKLNGQAWSYDWGAGLTAPFTEELAKGSGLLLLIALAPRLVRTAFDGFILGAFIGLGFQILEDIQYAVSSAGDQFGDNQIANAMSTIYMRAVLGVSAHILYSAVFCAGLVYFLGRPAQPRRRVLGLGLMATAMLFHGLWDSMPGIAGDRPWMVWVLILVLVAVAVITVRRVFAVTVVPERGFMRAVMAPEVVSGVVTQEELDVLAGDRKARKAYKKHSSGHGDRRKRAHLLEAAHDLADEIARAGGAETPRVIHARAEVARIRG